jgi:DsbC/DsbD-like thiol-disulfide interchange protein
MQRRLSDVGPRIARVIVAAALGVGLAAPSGAALAADAFSTDWAPGAKSQARLIAADQRLAGFEIKLAPGAITYWRNPGDSGLPPSFDFSGSDNVMSVEPIFPAPKRMIEADGGEAFGYDGGVIFPLRVTPRDAAKPVTLALDAQFAVCERICLPARARLKLTLPADAPSPYAAQIEAALAAAPRAVNLRDFGAISPAGADAWRLCAPAESGPPRALFVEAPEGWWVKVTAGESEPGKDCFDLALQDKPKGAAPPVALRLTLTGGAGPIETTLDAPAL